MKYRDKKGFTEGPAPPYIKKKYTIIVNIKAQYWSKIEEIIHITETRQT